MIKIWSGQYFGSDIFFAAVHVCVRAHVHVCARARVCITEIHTLFYMMVFSRVKFFESMGLFLFILRPCLRGKCRGSDTFIKAFKYITSILYLLLGQS